MNKENNQRKPGRPPSDTKTVRVQIQLSLHPGRDNDLIDFFTALPWGTKATAVIAAMRSGDLNKATNSAHVKEEEMMSSLMDLVL